MLEITFFIVSPIHNYPNIVVFKHRTTNM